MARVLVDIHDDLFEMLKEGKEKEDGCTQFILNSVKQGQILQGDIGNIIDRSKLDFGGIDFCDPHCQYEVQKVVDNAEPVFEDYLEDAE